MKKDAIFFGESGLTTTSANHIANMAKELCQTMETSIQGVRFYSTTVGLLNNSNKDLLKKGNTKEELVDIKDILKRIAKYKSLIAWLREAIKAKDRLIKEADNLGADEISEILNIEIPERPERGSYLSEDEFVSTWNIKKRNQFYYLDTVCAVIGSYIHPNGVFSKERKKLKDVVNCPNELRGEGMNAIMWSYVPSVEQEEIDEIFFDLQQTYRAYQAELNSIKHEIELALQANKRDIDEKYLNACRKYNAEVDAVSAQIEAYRKEQVAKMQGLKIIIPDSLKDIYLEVNGNK